MKNNQKGFALIEMVMVMALLSLFGVTIFTLVLSGAKAQEGVLRDKEAQTDARVVMSYINVRVRQNDEIDKISVVNVQPEPDENGDFVNAIQIKKRENDYDYWIYWYDGKLLECVTNPGEHPRYEFSFLEIIDVHFLDLDIDEENGCLTITIFYEYKDEIVSLTETIWLRSYGS